MIEDEDAVDITFFVFRDLATDNVLDSNDIPDFLNEYFVIFQIELVIDLKIL